VWDDSYAPRVWVSVRWFLWRGDRWDVCYVTLFLNGEPETARLILRELVNSTVGFEELAIETAKPNKSLHRMLSANGNPTMDNLTSILSVLRKKLKLAIKVETVPSA
jgi:DNA-binding phage protein